MGKPENRIIAGLMLVAVILVGIAYAAITNVTLNIKGTGNAQASKDNFAVEFVGEPTTGGKGRTTATIDKTKRTEGTMNVTGLTAKGDTATATYTVRNLSQDLSADLTAEATSSNQSYFEVICKLEDTTLKAKATTTLTVTVKLLKTPIDETKENLSSEIGVSITAEPKQVGEEANGGPSTITSNQIATSPYLPTGFTQVEGTNLSNGLTIQDSKGNQYVWVEVPMKNMVYQTAGLGITEFTDEVYAKIEEDLHTYTGSYSGVTFRPMTFMNENKTTKIEAQKLIYTNEYQNKVQKIVSNGNEVQDIYSSEEATGLTSEQYYELKKKMLKSVYQNGGFYVGKYETGIEDNPRTSGDETTMPTEIPVIKQNAYPYNYVTCSQAQTLASSMEAGSYNTSLPFGIQWNLVLKYLELKGTAQGNSTSWGNYVNNLWNVTNVNSKYYSGFKGKWISGAYGAKSSNSNILLSTGASETFSKQGIYDLAGNVCEWTLEYTSSSSYPCAFRGGSYNKGYNVDDGNGSDYNSSEDDIGFRVALY